VLNDNRCPSKEVIDIHPLLLLSLPQDRFETSISKHEIDGRFTTGIQHPSGGRGRRREERGGLSACYNSFLLIAAAWMTKTSTVTTNTTTTTTTYLKKTFLAPPPPPRTTTTTTTTATPPIIRELVVGDGILTQIKILDSTISHGSSGTVHLLQLERGFALLHTLFQ